MGVLQLLRGNHGGAQALLREDVEAGEDRLELKGEFKGSNLVHEGAGMRQYLNSEGGEINKFEEVNNKFNMEEINKMGAMFVASGVTLQGSALTGLLHECSLIKILQG